MPKTIKYQSQEQRIEELELTVQQLQESLNFTALTKEEVLKALQNHMSQRTAMQTQQLFSLIKLAVKSLTKDRSENNVNKVCTALLDAVNKIR